MSVFSSYQATNRGEPRWMFPPIACTSAVMSGSSDVDRLLRPLFRSRARDVFVVLWLNRQSRVTWFDLYEGGDLSVALMNPRRLFQEPFAGVHEGIILARYRSGGKPVASLVDRQIAKRLSCVGRQCGIHVKGYVVMFEDALCCLSEEGWGNRRPCPPGQA